MPTTTDRAAPSGTYSRLRVTLHWLIAALVALGATLGFVMSDLDAADPLRLWLGRAHFAVGVTTGLAMIARVIARVRSAPVEPLPLPALHLRFIGFIHGAIYVVLFGIVGAGMATSFASGWPAYLSGEVATAPSFADVAAREVHEVLVFALFALVFAHVAGVINHERKHGGALARMLGGKAK